MLFLKKWCHNFFFLIFQLESWFKGGGTKKAPGSRPTSQSSMLRPSSESDFPEADDNAIKIFEEQVNKMSEKEVNVKFDDLLVNKKKIQQKSKISTKHIFLE